MHNLYIAEIYRPEDIFLPLVEWVNLHSFLYSELRNIKQQRKVVRYGRSRSLKVVEIVPIESLYATYSD